MTSATQVPAELVCYRSECAVFGARTEEREAWARVGAPFVESTDDQKKTASQGPDILSVADL